MSALPTPPSAASPAPAPSATASTPDAVAFAMLVQLLARPDIEERLTMLVRRCAARLTLQGFEPCDRLEVGRESLSSDAHALTVSQGHASGAACGLLLRARLLLMGRAQSWGRGFLHLELSREGLPVLPLPGPESLLVQLELGKRAACAVPDSTEALEAHAAGLIQWLAEVRESFDAPDFAERTVDALAP